MRRSKVPNQHVAMVMVLEFCLHITGKLSSGHVTDTPTPVDTLKNNITDSSTCNNCSALSQESNTAEETCSNSRGWKLKGSEWGCCGNYDGCCSYASFVCYIHDALCKCCDVGSSFCGPTCKPEPDCVSENLDKLQNEKTANETNSNEQEHLNVETVEQALNDTGRNRTDTRNYFPRGRAISGTLFQDGGSEEGSGEV